MSTAGRAGRTTTAAGLGSATAAPGVKQEPPLPVSVELARDATADAALAEAIRDRLRNVLVVQTHIDLVPWGSLRRCEYKPKLVEH